jgi:hypothetical protein
MDTESFAFVITATRYSTLVMVEGSANPSHGVHPQVWNGTRRATAGVADVADDRNLIGRHLCTQFWNVDPLANLLRASSTRRPERPLPALP